jgi:hypothetical protein
LDAKLTLQTRLIWMKLWIVGQKHDVWDKCWIILQI